MKVFVTGGSGFLGQHLVKKLDALGQIVIAPGSKDCDLRNPKSLDSFQDNYDLIFHLAAYTQAGDWCLTHPGEQWIVNQEINTNVLSWWHRNHSSTKLIAMGTSCSYAPGANLEETNYLLGEPIESLYTYAMTKRMLLQGLMAIGKQYNQKFLYLVPSTLYGSSYHTDGRQMHFIFDLIRKILRGKYFGNEVVLWGSGNQKREIVHVDDFIENLMSLLQIGAEGIYNLGSGQEFTIRHFAEVICGIVDYDFRNIKFDLDKYVGAESKVLCVTKARAALTQYANRDLTLGISEVIEWFERSGSYKI